MRNDMIVTVRVQDLIAKLNHNRDQHARIVIEARAGYLAKARKKLEERLEQLAAGKIVSLQFGLSLPADHTAEYDTALGMLNMATDTTIKLAASDYRQLVEDEWSWSESFVYSNVAYSATCASLAQSRGIDVDAPGDEEPYIPKSL